MEVNKEEAARCRDIGADALRKNQFERAVKFLNKSLHLYPLPGVKPLLERARAKLVGESTTSTTSNNNNNNNMNNSQSTASSSTTPNDTDANGRSYTTAQVEIVNTVLRARQAGGRNAHYRILGLDPSADEAAIKKSYRKLALKLHPDKNSAPHADEAFKAVGLAYATLSDSQKRAVYDRYGDEDPDQRGGMRRGPQFHGRDVSPEDIFNMFFGGMPPGAAAGGFGGPGVRVYSTGFGPGFAFGGMHHPNMARQRAHQQQQRQQEDAGLLGQFLQFLPLIMILFLSFFNMPGDSGTGVGGSKYFSLTKQNPFVNPLSTKLTPVKDIPYFVSDQFLRTIYRDRYQLSQVERMVERSYERYLADECKTQKEYKKKLERMSTNTRISEEDRHKLTKKLAGFDLTRCIELEDLFPQSVPVKNRVNRQTSEEL